MSHYAEEQLSEVVRTAINAEVHAVLEKQQRAREWNAKVKGQYIQRQQAYQQRDIHAKREQTSYERKEEEWHKSDITTAKGGDVQGGNIDNWLAKQSNN